MNNRIIIDALTANQRLDKFLLKYFNKASKSFIYKMLRIKRIKLNNARAGGNEILKEGDEIIMYIAPDTMDGLMEIKMPSNVQAAVNVIFEDENIILVNKPKGLLTHSETAGDTDTLIGRVILYLYQKNEYDPSKKTSFTPAAVNRLDRNTSGIVVCAKNLPAAQALNSYFKEHKIEKFYICVAAGRFELNAGSDLILTGVHSKNPKTNKATIKQDGNGRQVMTSIAILKATECYSVLKIKLVTGRSHQIRVHLQSINHPIIGDIKYGNKDINKYYLNKYKIDSQLLHAEEIIFKENEGFLSYLFNRSFKTDLPQIFDQFI